MTKVRNQRLYSDDPAQLKAWAEDFDYIGRKYRLNLREGVITIFALTPKKDKTAKAKNERNKRAESAGRRS